MIIINIPVNIIDVLSTRTKHLDPIDIPPRRIRNALERALRKRLCRVKESQMDGLLREGHARGVMRARHDGDGEGRAERREEGV